jgi:high-affinity iron transporter
VIAGLVLALAAAAPAAVSEVEGARPGHPLAPPDLRRAAALLDYVCGDYQRAVSRRGRVKSPEELAEQRCFVREVIGDLERKAPETGRDLRERLVDGEARMSRGAPPFEVVPLLRGVRGELVQRFGLAQLPAGPPDLARGKRLYDTSCAGCHGLSGAPAPAEPPGLRAAPRAFARREEVRELSPQRAFGAITFGAGQEGAMPPWGAALTERDRWDLAYYVLTLARPLAPPQREAGFTLAALAGLPTDYAALATSTNRDLEEALTSTGSAPADVDLALAALRGAPERAARLRGLRRFWPLGLAAGVVLAVTLAVALRGGRRKALPTVLR